MDHLKKRADFLRAARGIRRVEGAVTLETCATPQADALPGRLRVGFTASKKIGNAVVRNRMKRRFRALARELLPAGGIRGADHVLIGRDGGIERDHAALKSEFGKALREIARGEDSPARPRKPKARPAR